VSADSYQRVLPVHLDIADLPFRHSHKTSLFEIIIENPHSAILTADKHILIPRNANTDPLRLLLEVPCPRIHLQLLILLIQVETGYCDLLFFVDIPQS
jgi:hypothetical protein